MPKIYDGEHCPKCGTIVQVVSGLEASDSTTAYQEVKCVPCNARFTESYTLTVLEEVDDDGHVVDEYIV